MFPVEYYCLPAALIYEPYNNVEMVITWCFSQTPSFKCSSDCFTTLSSIIFILPSLALTQRCSICILMYIICKSLYIITLYSQSLFRKKKLCEPPFSWDLRIWQDLGSMSVISKFRNQFRIETNRTGCFSVLIQSFQFWYKFSSKKSLLFNTIVFDIVLVTLSLLLYSVITISFSYIKMF